MADLPTTGDAFDGTKLIAAITGLQGEVNAIPMSALRRRGLGHEHVADLVDWTLLFPNGMTAGYANNNSANTYSGGLAGTWSPLTVNLQSFGTSGAVPPYGPSVVADPGWRILASSAATGANPAEVTFVTGGSTMAGRGLHGTFIRGCVEVGDTDETAATGVGAFDCIWVAIGFYDGTSRYILERSIRYFSMNAHTTSVIGTGCYVKDADLTTHGATQFESFFLAVARRAPVDNEAGGRGVEGFDVGSYWISCLPMKAGDL